MNSECSECEKDGLCTSKCIQCRRIFKSWGHVSYCSKECKYKYQDITILKQKISNLEARMVLLEEKLGK